MRIGQSLGPAGVGARRDKERSSGQRWLRRANRWPSRRCCCHRRPSTTDIARRYSGSTADRRAAYRPAPARQRGDELLDALDELKLALLDGKLPPGKLRALQSMAAAQRAEPTTRHCRRCWTRSSCERPSGSPSSTVIWRRGARRLSFQRTRRPKRVVFTMLKGAASINLEVEPSGRVSALASKV